MNTNNNFVLIGKPYNPDLKNTKKQELNVLYTLNKLNKIDLKKSALNFGFAVAGALTYGTIVVLSRRS